MVEVIKFIAFLGIIYEIYYRYFAGSTETSKMIGTLSQLAMLIISCVQGNWLLAICSCFLFLSMHFKTIDY